MSEQNGDKARFQLERQRKLLRRERIRELLNARKPVGGAEPKRENR